MDLAYRRPARANVLAVTGLAGAVLMLASCARTSMSDCEANGSCDEPGGDGAAGTSIDGAPVSTDARPSGSMDAAPADLCAGVDCSDLDDPCNRGVCDPDTGECLPQPINEDMPCAERLCGDFDACIGFEEPCGEIGTHARTCQDLTCRAGACEVGAPYEDEQNCSRDTDGLTCDVPQSSCSPCGGFSSACDESGTETCTETTFACGNATCRPSSTSSTQACSRVTDGRPCGTRSCNFNQGTVQLCCNSSQSCSVDCGECMTLGAPVFR